MGLFDFFRRPDPRIQEYREAELRLRTLEANAKSKALERQIKLQESMTDVGTVYDWVGAYSDLISRYRNEPNTFQLSTVYDRRYGRNWPFFQSEQELALLRMPSRISLSTNPYAQGMVRGLCSYVIGNGFTYKASAKTDECPPELCEAVQEILDEFIARNNWGPSPDVAGKEAEESLERELFWRSYEDGEFFLDHIVAPGGLTDIRTIEPEQVTQSGSTWGVEGLFGVLSPVDDAMKRLAYWVFFGDNPSAGESYAADRISHFRRGVKRSIKRGLPEISFGTYDAIETAWKLAKALGIGGGIQATIPIVVEHAAATATQVQSFVDALADYQQPDLTTGQIFDKMRHTPGERWDMPQNTKFVSPPAFESPEGFEVILHAMLRAAGHKWNAPEWLATGSGADMAAYTASLTAESPFVRYGEADQGRYKSVFARTMWIVVRNKVNAENGRLTAVRRKERVTTQSYSWEEICRLVEIQIEGPSLVMRDKLQEAQRFAIEQPLGADSRQRYAAEQGRDWDRISQDNQEYEEEHGPPGGGLGLPPDEGDKGGGSEGKVPFQRPG